MKVRSLYSWVLLDGKYIYISPALQKLRNKHCAYTPEHITWHRLSRAVFYFVSAQTLNLYPHNKHDHVRKRSLCIFDVFMYLHKTHRITLYGQWA